MAMMYAASSNLTFAHTHTVTHTHTPPPPGLPFIRRRSTGYRWLGAPTLRPSPPPPQLQVGGEECPCPSPPSPPSPPLLHRFHLRCLHFLPLRLLWLLSLPLSPRLLLLLLHLHLLLLLPLLLQPQFHFLSPGEESGAAGGPAAAEEAGEGYGVCWSSLQGGETDERKRKEIKEGKWEKKCK